MFRTNCRATKTQVNYQFLKTIVDSLLTEISSPFSIVFPLVSIISFLFTLNEFSISVLFLFSPVNFPPHVYKISSFKFRLGSLFRFYDRASILINRKGYFRCVSFEAWGTRKFLGLFMKFLIATLIYLRNNNVKCTNYCRDLIFDLHILIKYT